MINIKRSIAFFLLFISFFIAGFVIDRAFFTGDCDFVTDYCDERFKTGYGVPLGFYVPDQYFCVRTYQRSYEEIMKTTAHEISHVFVYRDGEHFCRDEYMSCDNRTASVWVSE